MEAQENTNSIYSKRVNDFNILQVRLDTSELLDKIELFLRGSRHVITEDQETGRILTQKVKIGLAKANDNGIQSILNWVNATVNPHTVQGNFPADKRGFSETYERYIQEYHIEMATLLVANCYNWGIQEDEIDGIIEFVMLMIMPFMSRLIDNKERESYNETLKSVESNITRDKSKFPLMNG